MPAVWLRDIQRGLTLLGIRPSSTNAFSNILCHWKGKRELKFCDSTPFWKLAVLFPNRPFLIFFLKKQIPGLLPRLAYSRDFKVLESRNTRWGSRNFSFMAKQLLRAVTVWRYTVTEVGYHCYEWRSAWHTMSMKTETNHHQARIQDLYRRNKPSIFHTSEFHFESWSFEGSIHSSNPIDWSDTSEAADWAEAEAGRKEVDKSGIRSRKVGRIVDEARILKLIITLINALYFHFLVGFNSNFSILFLLRADSPGYRGKYRVFTAVKCAVPYNAVTLFFPSGDSPRPYLSPERKRLQRSLDCSVLNPRLVTFWRRTTAFSAPPLVCRCFSQQKRQNMVHEYIQHESIACVDKSFLLFSLNLIQIVKKEMGEWRKIVA